MQYLNKYFVQFFEFIHGLIKLVVSNPNVSYGLAIIAFTAIIRILLLPLTIKQTRSQVAIQKIQPEMKKIQDRYKNDPQKAQQEIMKLYKENNANPLSGCLPMLIQMPILFALFYVFNTLQGINGVSFLWVPNLAAKDPYYIFPILSAATTYISSTMMVPKSSDSAQAKQTSTMNIAMSVFFGFMSLNFKAALVVYFVTNNLFQIAQSWVMLSNRKKDDNSK